MISRPIWRHLQPAPSIAPMTRYGSGMILSGPLKICTAMSIFDTISKRLKAANLTFLSEPYGGPWKEAEVMPMVHQVMAEFWTGNGVYTPYITGPMIAVLRKAGKNLIEAEAFTGQPADSKWSEYPAWLKPIGDAAFCAGVNRIILHRFTHQPWDAKYKPGNTMGQWGTHFDRTQTWWNEVPAMVDYWQRCQALLQWGDFCRRCLALQGCGAVQFCHSGHAARTMGRCHGNDAVAPRIQTTGRQNDHSLAV